MPENGFGVTADTSVSDEGKRQEIVSVGKIGTDAQPVVVILFDLLNANLANRGYGQKEIIEALKRVESGESVYLYLLTPTGNLYPVHALPSAGIAADPEAAGWTQHIEPLLNAAIDGVFGLKPREEMLVNVRIGESYDAIRTLASTMESIPGWKNMIWITNGVPLPWSRLGSDDYAPIFYDLATALDRTNVTLSSVYPGRELGTGNLDTLSQFADLTGGKVYANDVEKALSDITTTWRSGYVIQYAAPPADGKFRKVRVGSSRKGIRIHTKQGYYNQ
jgi:VWFA-related protein